MTAVDNRNKYPWIDTIKSIGIYLVVLGHLWYLSSFSLLNKLIYSFHMPMFFIISGYLYNYKENESYIEFIRKKFLRLALPAVIWITATFPIYIFKNRSLTIKDIIFKLLLFDGSVPFNDPCWFFISLFFVFIMIRSFKIKNKSSVYSLCISIIAFGLGYLMYSLRITDYFMIEKTIIGTGFFMIGRMTRQLELDSDTEKNKSLTLYICFASLVLWIVFGCVLNDKVSLYGMELGNYWCFILSGIFGTIFLYETVKYIYIYIYINKSNNQTFLECYPVRASIFIVCSHYIPITIYKVIMNRLGIAYTWKYNLITPCFALLLIILYYPFSVFISQKLPILNGEMRK